MGLEETGDTWCFNQFILTRGFPGGSVGKESACNVGDPGSTPRLGRSPGEGNGNPRQYSCPGNPMDRGGWWATVRGVKRVRHDLATKPPHSQDPGPAFSPFMRTLVCTCLHEGWTQTSSSDPVIALLPADSRTILQPFRSKLMSFFSPQSTSCWLLLLGCIPVTVWKAFFWIFELRFQAPRCSGTRFNVFAIEGLSCISANHLIKMSHLKVCERETEVRWWVFWRETLRSRPGGGVCGEKPPSGLGHSEETPSGGEQGGGELLLVRGLLYSLPWWRCTPGG